MDDDIKKSYISIGFILLQFYQSWVLYAKCVHDVYLCAYLEYSLG